MHSGLLGAVCVALFVSAAPVRVGCFLSSPAVGGLVRVLPFLCCWSALVGRLSVVKCAFWGSLLLFALSHLFHLLRLFVTPLCNTQTPLCTTHTSLMVSCSGFGLPMHAQLLRLFVTNTQTTAMFVGVICHKETRWFCYQALQRDGLCIALIFTASIHDHCVSL